MKKHVIYVLSIACVAACTDEPISGAGEASHEVAMHLCEKAHECREAFPTSTGLMFETFFGRDVTSCTALVERNATPSAIDASVNTGRINYNDADARACTVKLEALMVTCDQFWIDPQIPVECEAMLRGTVANGGACTIDLDCLNEGSMCVERTCR